MYSRRHLELLVLAWGLSCSGGSPPPPPPPPGHAAGPLLAVGAWHACAIFAQGALRCWGDNQHGQLGRSGPLDPLAAYSVDLGAGRTARRVFAGTYHTCVVLDGDQVKCWGDNAYGQLGLGDMITRGDGLSAMGDGLPVLDLGVGQRARAVAAGDAATCALLETGRIKCWGNAYNGALGYGDNVSRGDVPGTMGDALPAVDLGSHEGRPLTVKEVAAIDYHSFCAILNDAPSDVSALKCWGSNDYCELGIGTRETGRAGTPETTGDRLGWIDLGTTTSGAKRRAVTLAGGYQFICALGADGRVVCWGENFAGQTGVGVSGPSRSCNPDEVGDANLVSLPAPAVAIAARGGSDNRGAHACALLDTHEVTCWGENAHGQLGTGDTTWRIAPSPPLVFPEGFVPTKLVLGDVNSCALSEDGRIKCWGDGEHGQLVAAEPGAGEDRLAPGPDLRLVGRPARALAAGHDHTCAVLDGGAVKCWGRSSDGQLGLGDRTGRGAQPGQMGDALPAVDLGGDAAIAVAAGAAHTCAVLSGGPVKCWGAGGGGRLGLGDTADRLSPHASPVPLGAPASSVAAGADFSCALGEDGDVRCWGAAGSGQLGSGETMDRPAPPAAPLDLRDKAIAIAAGDAHACALLAGGHVACWGANGSGQLGVADLQNRLRPALASLGAVPAKAISARARQTCALLQTGALKCWGDNASGQLGLGDAMARPAPPNGALDLGAGRLASRVAVGGAFACAVLDLGQVKCWGSNAAFELGSSLLAPAYGDEPGETGDALPAAVQGGGRSVTAVVGGRAHACVILDTGDVRCWGDNTFGQLGAGDAAVHAYHLAPTATIDLGGW